ncbi:MAG: sugar ABC transporter permease [Clostridia bacterium]|nr:sugar ABC transporter permease [Clostridia bacterium]MBR4459433.1 sugar ABC transporter permease [Clostridia bacterium]
MTIQRRGTGAGQRSSIGVQGFFRRLGSQWQLVLMSVPMLLYVFLFNYAPLWGWSNAFRDIAFARGTWADFLKGKEVPWIGLQNFDDKIGLFRSGAILFTDTIRNTVAMSVINLVLSTLAAIVLAVLLNEVRQKAFKRTVQTVTYLPHFLSMVIVVGIAQIIFDSSNLSPGPVNSLLLSTGIVRQGPDWLNTPGYFWWLVAVINVWKEVGWGTIIYISAMTGIDPCLYEAASIDGAGRWQRILHVTLPGIRATFVILLIMNIGHLLDTGFEMQYLLKRNATEQVAYTIDLYVMEYGIRQNDYGLATAAGIFKSVIAIILLTGANFISKKLGEDSLM